MLYNICTYGVLGAYAGQEAHAEQMSGRPSRFTKTFNKKICVSFDTIDHDPSADFKVLVQSESPTMYQALTQKILDNHQKFDLILTYDERLLHLPNAKHFLPVAQWIQLDLSKGKLPLITFLMSSKRITYHHMFRFKAAEVLESTPNNHGMQYQFYRSPPRLERKADLLDQAMFHVAMENQPIPNMFTEKLLDAFIARAVPIYFGCTNIEKFFDTSGMIRFETPAQLAQIKRDVSQEQYIQMQPAIERNYELAQEYRRYSVFERIEKVITENMR